MKIKKRYSIVLVYLVIVVLFFIALDPIMEFLTKMQHDEVKGLFNLFVYPIKSVGYIPSIVFGFAIVTTFLSIVFYYIYRRRKKIELMKGYKIISILSIILLVYLILGIIFS